MTTTPRPTLHVVQVNYTPPQRPLTCGLCPELPARRRAVTARLTFDGMRHPPGATPAERRKHGPGWWVDQHCATVLEGGEVLVEDDQCAVRDCRGLWRIAPMEPGPTPAVAHPSLF